MPQFLARLVLDYPEKEQMWGWAGCIQKWQTSFENGFTYCEMDNTSQPTVSCVNHILTQIKLLFFQITNNWSVAGSHGSVIWCHHFYFFIFWLHEWTWCLCLNHIAFVCALCDLICVQRRPGMAGIKPKVVTYKWRQSQEMELWQEAVQTVRTAARRPWTDAGHCVMCLQHCVRVESSHPQCRAGLYPPLSCIHIDMSLLFA